MSDNYAGRIILQMGIPLFLNVFALTGCSQENNSNVEAHYEAETTMEDDIKQEDIVFNMPSIEVYPDGTVSAEIQHQNQCTAGVGQLENCAAINTYLTVDWTSREVLWEHDIMPNDSGSGWEFWLADIDFDGVQEMLISFLANHCGQNSLYVYKYENNSVSSYFDMIAVPDKDVITLIDYKKISPYMDIELADAYVNQQNEYRYLSIDCFCIGGMEQIFLYEAGSGDAFKQEELARITYYSGTDQWEIYFKGDELASAEELHDMISQHMEGYEKQEICYRHLEKSFPRDIIAVSADEQKRELEELYDSFHK